MEASHAPSAGEGPERSAAAPSLRARLPHRRTRADHPETIDARDQLASILLRTAKSEA